MPNSRNFYLAPALFLLFGSGATAQSMSAQENTTTANSQTTASQHSRSSILDLNRTDKIKNSLRKSDQVILNKNLQRADHMTIRVPSQREMGNSSGGGQDQVTDANGKVTSASAYAQVELGSDEINLKDAGIYEVPETIADEVRKVQRILMSTLVKPPNIPGIFKSKVDLISTDVLNPSIKYILVDEIPDHNTHPIFQQCENVTTKVQLPDGSARTRSACTLYGTPYTFLRRSHFAIDLDRQDVINYQALTLIHEGLRRRGIPDEDVSLIDASLRAALDLLNEQLHGSRDDLTSEQTRLLGNLVLLSNRFGLANKNSMSFDFSNMAKVKVWIRGGGYVNENSLQEQYDPTTISATAFVGIGTAVDEGAIADNVTLIDTNICQEQTCFIGKNSTIAQSQITNSQLLETRIGITEIKKKVVIGENVIINNTDARNMIDFVVGSDVRISNFKISNTSFMAKPDSAIENASFSFLSGQKNIEVAQLAHLTNLTLGQKSVLRDISVTSAVPVNLNADAQLSGPTDEEVQINITYKPSFFAFASTAPGLALTASSIIDVPASANSIWLGVGNDKVNNLNGLLRLAK